MQANTIITNISEWETHVYWQAVAEYRAAVAAGDTEGAADALDEIEGIARGSERGAMRWVAGAMLDQNRPGWREAEDDGPDDEPFAAGPSYSERDLNDGMVEIRVILPRGAESGLFRAFREAIGTAQPVA
ncbi:hypothetical protein Sa4125_39100 [Aureimonas sp. SA4125]|uniref:hypothetical protein n=1 Tax=Aureimonas sp. SA4125 TaxID=2826993 RepID=UPI001CC6B91A|nr:hypothetical protein [Aureimonas sp. SA4125]BDA86368.1 hypothetical protein Sa4125_39100 [Aureimonas sp. SA4125]